MSIVPINQLGGRAPEAGRIRLGVKSGRGMRSIDTFRFTSPHADVIDAAAAQFGAKQGPRPWSDPKMGVANQFEVITEVSQIDVFLPPEALSCWYEQWSGGGCVRRCDGEQVQVVVGSGDESAMSEVPCICDVEDNMQCRPTSRLSVILPTLPFRGVWRLESKGWNAMHELSGMEAAIASLQQSMGVIKAQLSLEQRTQRVMGQTKKFVVPKLGLPVSAHELMAGQARPNALTAPDNVVQLRELPEAPAWDDDDVVEAELVEVESDPPTGLRAEVLALFDEHLPLLDKERALTQFVRAASKDRKRNFDALTDKQQGWVIAVVRDVALGRARWVNVEVDEPAKVEAV